MDAPLNLVLVHDWLTGMRGGEKCLEVVCRRWPDARLFTLLHRRGSVSPAIERMRPRCSVLQYLPQVHRYYRHLLPLMPFAAAQWRLPECDVLVSFSHCVAKSATPPSGVPHICYCFTPIRYAWHMRDAYFGTGRTLKRKLVEALLRHLRDWDRRTASCVSHFVAISKTVQQRIAECYGRDSRVIYPPVDTEFYRPAPTQREDFYLVVSAFAPYKRIDLAIAACRKLGRRLVVVGSGQQANALQAAADERVQFLGWQPDVVIRDQLRRCRALLFPGEEDFGIVPLEAHACGTPVIAYGRGGATESVLPMDGCDEPTGVWFADQTAECLAGAIETFEKRMDEIAPDAARRRAEQFSTLRYEREIVELIEEVGQDSVPDRHREKAIRSGAESSAI